MVPRVTVLEILRIGHPARVFRQISCRRTVIEGRTSLAAAMGASPGAAETDPSGSGNVTQSSSSMPLWEQIKHRYEAAQASQASSFTETSTEVVNEELSLRSSSTTVQYIVKIARRLRDKPKNNNKKSTSREEKMRNNPFLPPDPNLYVTRLTDTHSLVLNKFNITPHHVIVITDAFQEQEVPLNLKDFEATWMVVRNVGDEGLGGMAFFNRGPLSGASQPHKHIQCVPLPIARDKDGQGMEAPFERIIGEAISETRGVKDGSVPASVELLPFVNAVHDVRNATPEALHRAYGSLLDSLEERLQRKWTRDDSYNMLLTKDYMMVIPRHAEHIESVGANAMGFAGSFFLGTQAEIDDLKRLGPSKVLGALGFDASN